MNALQIIKDTQRATLAADVARYLDGMVGGAQ